MVVLRRHLRVIRLSLFPPPMKTVPFWLLPFPFALQCRLVTSPLRLVSLFLHPQCLRDLRSFSFFPIWPLFLFPIIFERFVLKSVSTASRSFSLFLDTISGSKCLLFPSAISLLICFLVHDPCSAKRLFPSPPPPPPPGLLCHCASPGLSLS